MPSLRRFLPDPASLRNNRWLRWLGPSLFHPRLWLLNRRTLALGTALGVFFGLLIPVAQIPASAAMAVVLRANVPAAVASTLVTNPVTFGPVYYLAWQLGRTVLGEPAPEPSAAATPPADPAKDEGFSLRRLLDFALGVGKPLVVGLAIMAVAIGALTYLAVHWFWTWRVWRSRRQRVKLRNT